MQTTKVQINIGKIEIMQMANQTENMQSWNNYQIRQKNR